MKKSILFALMAIAMFATQAQTYTLVYEGDTLADGDTIFYAITREDISYGFVSLPSIYVIKNSDADVFTDNNITYVQGNNAFAVNEVCGGGLCPQPGSYKLAIGEIDSNKFLSLHYTFVGEAAAGGYALHRFTIGTIADSMAHGIGDTVGAPLESLSETTSVYILVHNGSYVLGLNPAAELSFQFAPSVLQAGTPIVMNSDKAGTALVYDETGRLVASQPVAQGQSSLPTSGYAKGLYMVVLQSGNSTSVAQKFVVQ